MHNNGKKLSVFSVFVVVLTIAHSSQSLADEISRDLAAKITHYNKKLVEWSHHPSIIDAVKKSNSSRAHVYAQAEWETFFDEDPQLAPYLRTPAARLLVEWETPDLAKLFVRDRLGNIVAGATKPKFFNIAKRLPFTNALVGRSWADDAIKPDPLIKHKSVQISAPIKDESGTVIGVIHSAVIER